MSASKLQRLAEAAETGPTRYLTYDGLIETVGSDTVLDDVTNLEILFLTFDEIADSSKGVKSVFQHIPNLTKLALLDNSLKHISGLEPISLSLTSLTVCDQPLSSISNNSLNMPNLRELHLHRNKITSLSALCGCPRLTKLWVFQNKLTSLQDLHATPELRILWVQANNVASLKGIEMVPLLQELAIAGNPVSDFAELQRLKRLRKLSSLSCNDVHFGRCPVSDDKHYKNFVMTCLKQVTLLDDVQVTKQRSAIADDIYTTELRAFSDGLDTIENEYQKEIASIDSAFSNRHAHCAALEKEMTVALSELQNLVSDGRKTIKAHVAHHDELMASNLASLEIKMQELMSSSKEELSTMINQSVSEHDLASSLFLILERVLMADQEVTRTLCEVSSHGMLCSSQDKTGIVISGKKRSSNEKRLNKEPVLAEFAFQSLASSSPDFHLYASQVQAAANVGATNADTVVGSAESSNAEVYVKPLELARLFRFAGIPGTGNQSVDATECLQIFSVVTAEQLKAVLTKGWAALKGAAVFSTQADIIAAFYTSYQLSFGNDSTHYDGSCFAFDSDESYKDLGHKSTSEFLSESQNRGENTVADASQMQEDTSTVGEYANDEFENSQSCDDYESVESGQRVNAGTSLDIAPDTDEDEAYVADVGAEVDEIIENSYGASKKGFKSSRGRSKESKEGKGRAKVGGIRNKEQRPGSSEKSVNRKGSTVKQQRSRSLSTGRSDEIFSGSKSKSSHFSDEQKRKIFDSKNTAWNTVMDASHMSRLSEAKDKKVYLLVSASVSRKELLAGAIGSLQSNLSSDATETSIPSCVFPQTRQEAAAMYSKLLERKDQTYATRIDAATIMRSGQQQQQQQQPTTTTFRQDEDVLLLSMQPHTLDNILPVTRLEHASICVSPPIDGAGIRSIEGRLELLMLPTQTVDRSASLLNRVHNDISNHVHNHVAQLMEELSEQHATALKKAENNIRSRENHLKSLRDDVERERKQQEAMLREMRSSAIEEERSNSKAKGKSSRR